MSAASIRYEEQAELIEYIYDICDAMEAIKTSPDITFAIRQQLLEVLQAGLDKAQASLASAKIQLEKNSDAVAVDRA